MICFTRPNCNRTYWAPNCVTTLSSTRMQPLEKGDPSVGLGVYAMALFGLGFGDPPGNIIDVSRDDTGLMLDEERLPKLVRMNKPGKSKP